MQCNVSSLANCLLTASCLVCLRVAGQHDSSTDGRGGLRGVHIQGVGEQRTRRLPRHHGGVGAAAAQAADKAQHFPQRPEASVTAPAAAAAGPD